MLIARQGAESPLDAVHLYRLYHSLTITHLIAQSDILLREDLIQ